MNNKNLVKGTMVYSLSTIVTKLGSLIFLPIITRLLTKEEFGIVGTLGPIATLFAVILVSDLSKTHNLLEILILQLLVQITELPHKQMKSKPRNLPNFS